MKANLKKILGLAALGMTLLATTVPTWAGYVSASEVSISSTGDVRLATGSMVGARYSADSTQYIGCYINAAPFAVCFARDSAGTFLGCVSHEEKHIASVQRMTDSSSFQIRVKPGSSACHSIYIFNQSSGLK
jgi:hypothetical protein